MGLGQAQVGTLKSTPKLTRINGDDNLAVIWRNMGNNHAYPFVYGLNVTLTSGTDVVIASGISYHGNAMAESTFLTLAVVSGTADGYVYAEKDKTNNVITIKSTGSNSVEVDVLVMVGEEPEIDGIYCRGFGNPAQDRP
jgi:hypothetical protein